MSLNVCGERRRSLFCMEFLRSQLHAISPSIAANPIPPHSLLSDADSDPEGVGLFYVVSILQLDPAASQ
jgi:hypothetical protein